MNMSEHNNSEDYTYNSMLSIEDGVLTQDATMVNYMNVNTNMGINNYEMYMDTDITNRFDHQVALATIPNLPPMPEQFCTEFLEYNRDSYKNARHKRNKLELNSQSPTLPSSNDMDPKSDSNSRLSEANNLNLELMSSQELRRQIHIQSEQKRRAQIKDGFEALRQRLPNCSNRQISKASILSKTVVHLSHLKATQNALLQEIERLRLENDQLRQIQEVLCPKQPNHLNSIYSLGL